MFKIIMKIVVFLGLSLGLYAGNGLSQSHLRSVSPSASESGVSQDIVVEIKFDLPLKEKSVKKHTIVLQHNNKKVRGLTVLVGDDTLRFTPNKPLEEGIYIVKVKKVKLQKETNHDNVQHEPKNGFQRFIYWLCSLFYGNPADCPLCKKICGNSGNNIVKTQKINYIFSVDESPKVVNIVLSETSIELHEGNETTLSATANYDDNTTQNITNDVEWMIEDSSIVSVTNGAIKALKEGTTTLQAKYKNVLSSAATVNVYKEINGYMLPLEPDPKVNNATLLGVDSNGNGVRDDVERKIIIKYKKPIEIELMMANAKVTQEILKSPLSEAKELQKKFAKIGDCEMYLFRMKIDIEDSVGDTENYTYNTKERAKKYIEYNKALGGGVYGGSPNNYKAEACDFDVELMLKDRK